MKKTLSILLLFYSAQAISQNKSSFRLNVYTSYVFDDGVDSYYSTTSYYNGTINGSFQWGLGLEYMVNPAQGVELSYLRQDTKAPTTYYDDDGIGDPVKTRDFDVAVNYITLGTTRYLKVNPKLEPYFGLQLGVGIFGVSNPTNGNEHTATKFAWGVKAGTNIWLGENVGLKLQAALQSATQAVGGSLYFGTGGVSTGVSSFSTIYQFSLGGGVVFNFGGIKAGK